MTFFKNNSNTFFTISTIFLLFSIFNLKNIKFHNNPLELRNQQSTSVATMNELIKDKSLNPNSVDILVKNIQKELN